MKKIFLSLAIILSFLILPSQVLAQEDQEKVQQNKMNQVVEEKPTVATAPAIIKYDLAYPGMLPDSPFYKLKVLRDRITLALISDPKKKMEFYLLQADKGILAAAMLVDKGNAKLAAATALKAEHNYTLLTHELGRLSKKSEKEFLKKLETAALKHQEILTSLSKRVKGEDKKTFETVQYFSKTNLETVNNYQESK